jgi:hypothetical protein
MPDTGKLLELGVQPGAAEDVIDLGAEFIRNYFLPSQNLDFYVWHWYIC